MNWEPIILSFRLALVTTTILLLIGIPLAYWLSSTKIKIKPAIEAIVGLPLVLPPTVLGFYFLLFMSPSSAWGAWLNEVFNIQLVFTFEGLVLASVIYSLPFMVHPIQSGLSGLPNSLYEASILMGKSKWTTLTKILLPNIKKSLITGIVLTFAHTLGEFGVVLMIGGSIPGVTKVASIAIYDEVESLNYGAANQYALFLIVVTFITLLLVYSNLKPFNFRTRK